MNIHDIAHKFSQLRSESGHSFECQLIPGDVEVLQVDVSGREELPIFISVTDEQILCISYLWGEDEVNEASRSDMLAAMLEMSIPMPLSSFAKVDTKYVIFGALSVNSSFDDIAHEIVVLSDNSVDAISSMTDYLK